MLPNALWIKPNFSNLEKNLNAGGADLTLAGYPSSNGNGGRLTPEFIMCINTKAKEKQGAWEFISYATDRGTKVQRYLQNSATPTLEKNFDYLLENEASMGTHSASGNEFPALTKEENLIRLVILKLVKSLV